MSRDREFIREFAVECREGLDRIDTELVALEATPGDEGRLNTILRTLHTIKGNSSFLDFTRLGELAHAGEALLAKLRDRQLEMTPGIADALLRMSSALRQLVAVIDSTGDEGMDEQALLVQELREWTAGSANAPGPLAATIVVPPEEIGKPGITPSKAAFSETSSLPAQPQAGSEPPPVAKAGLPPVVATAPLESPPGAAPVTPPPTRGVPASDPASVSSISMMTDSELATVIRVPIEQLDHLMNLVGELVLARNHIVQIVSGRQDDELTEPVQRLKMLMTSLQDGVMRTRMQPVRTAWRRYPRIVRDLGKQCGKQVELELQGGDTELDKSMLEAIADPLVHLVRNAVDHGIEKPYLRKIKGKPETGRLVVRAFQESGQVHIEILDDGAGLDLERVRQKAVAAGILTPERALLVSESELQESVFLPGFTTADRVTGLSGRGVGMDVVKTSVEQIGGTIELETRKDVGTTVRLTVPLTLAIIPAFIVFCGRQRFTVPQLNVVELLRLRGDEQRQACDHFHDAPVLRLRGELLPLADLCLRLGLASASDLASREQLNILVVKTGTRRFALLVDEIGDAQEIVVKPLGSLFANRPEFSGAALMGDGGIALILDVLGIARAAGLLDGHQSLLSGAVVMREETSRLDEQVLVCEVDGDRRIALPLADVVRLEQIPPTRIEHSASGDRLQYHGHNLPLRQLSRHPCPRTTAAAEFGPLSVVVYGQQETQLGLLVDRIVDVAPRPSQLQPVDLPEDPGSKCRVTATAVVLGRITDFVEVN